LEGAEAYQRFWGTDAEKPPAEPALPPAGTAYEEEEAIRIKMARTRIDIWEYGQEAYVNSYTETNRSAMITHEITAVVNGRAIPTTKIRSRYRESFFTTQLPIYGISCSADGAIQATTSHLAEGLFSSAYAGSYDDAKCAPPSSDGCAPPPDGGEFQTSVSVIPRLPQMSSSPLAAEYDPYDPEYQTTTSGCSPDAGETPGTPTGEDKSFAQTCNDWDGKLYYDYGCIEQYFADTGEWKEIWCGTYAVCET
jgi:hypothetical protein